jgi:2-haloacid dehalogenase
MLAVDKLGVPAEEMAFISSNAWDAQGALAFGMKVFWVNRTRQPEEYGLGANATVIADLSALPTLVA